MTTFTVKFFARLREETGTEELQVSVTDVTRLSELKTWLLQSRPEWQRYLEANLLTAVNQTMVRGDRELQPGDEVALFPPVTGG